MTISVAMCTYNGALYVAQQLESIAAQSCLPDEVIVCDDSSTDKTVEIVHRFADAAPFPVRLHVNATRLRSTRNFERAIGLCTCDVIALSDWDDYWYPQHLARLGAAFDSPEVGLAFSDADLVTERLELTGQRFWDLLRLDAAQRQLIEGPLGADALLPGWFVGGGCMAFRSVFRKVVLPIPTDLPMIHDGWIAAVIAGLAAIKSIDEPLIQYRRREGQQAWVRHGPGHAPGITAAWERVNSYDEQIAVASRVLERLTSQSDFPLRPRVARRLGSRLTHLEARSTLPTGMLKRAVPVFRELMTGRYHVFSNGLLSAAKDMWPRADRPGAL